jgi:autotransporter-associated beta strand protein
MLLFFPSSPFSLTLCRREHLMKKTQSIRILILHRPSLLVFLAAAILLSNPVVSFAAGYFWNVPSGDWSTASNWKPQGEPTSEDEAYIDNGGTVSVTQAEEVCYYLRLGYLSSLTSGTLNITDGSLELFTMSVGTYGTGTVNHSGGTITVDDGSLFVGSNASANGTYNLSDSGELLSVWQYIGRSGTGIFNQSGGINNTWGGRLMLGENASSSGTYNLTGGILIPGSISKGSGSAAFNFGGGILQSIGILTTTLPMTLTGINGNANIDSAGHSVGLFGILSGTGGLNKLGAGTLTLKALNTYNGDTVVNGGTLEIVGGIGAGGTSLIDVQSGKAVLKTVDVNKLDLDVVTAASATFEVASGTHLVDEITGGGTTQVDNSAILSAESIHQGTLTIGSGAKVVIRPLPGGPLSGAISPVPEPSTIVLLVGAFLFLMYRWIKK